MKEEERMRLERWGILIHWILFQEQQRANEGFKVEKLSHHVFFLKYHRGGNENKEVDREEWRQRDQRKGVIII